MFVSFRTNVGKHNWPSLFLVESCKWSWNPLQFFVLEFYDTEMVTQSHFLSNTCFLTTTDRPPWTWSDWVVEPLHITENSLHFSHPYQNLDLQATDAEAEGLSQVSINEAEKKVELLIRFLLCLENTLYSLLGRLQ